MNHKPFVPNFTSPSDPAKEQPSVAWPEAPLQAPSVNDAQIPAPKPGPNPSPSPSQQPGHQPAQQPGHQPAQLPGHQPGSSTDHEVEVPQPNHPGQSEPLTPVGEPKTEKTQLLASESPYPQGKPLQAESPHTSSSSHGLPKAARLGDKHPNVSSSLR